MHETNRVLVYKAENEDNLTIVEEPLVSVIIPTHNRKEVLKMALESVIKQTYANYEVIVIDDASIDGTSDWISTHYPDIGFIRLDKQGGPAKARNEGIKVAKGILIAFLDSDDIWLPEYLRLQVSALTHNPRSIMSFCGCIEVQEDGTPMERGYRHKPKYPDLVHRLLLEQSFIVTMSAVVIPLNKLQEAGYLNERLWRAQDRELYIRLLQLGGDITYIPKELVIRYLLDVDSMGFNLCFRAQNSTLLLDIFFSNKKNEEYRYLESMARGMVYVNLLDSFLYDKIKPRIRLEFLVMACIIFFRYWRYVRRDIYYLILRFIKYRTRKIINNILCFGRYKD